MPTSRRHLDPSSSRMRPTSAIHEHETRAPKIISDVLQSPGQLLDDQTRRLMEARFGHDFSDVHVYTDARANRTARALDARAYTMGRDIVFGENEYAPTSLHGEQLIAHELVHVAQQRDSSAGSTFELGDPQHAAEQEATQAEAGGSVQVSENSQPGVIRRSLLGGILGGLGGALGGALIGGLLGGPIGAVIGGVAGLIGGAILGNEVSTESRALNSEEIRYARDVFRDSIDYSKIRITRDSMYSVGAPLTIGNTVHLKSSWGHFKDDTLELTQTGLETLIHEMGHVWQYQNGGLAYIPKSLAAQFAAFVSGGDRGGAYDWRSVHREGKPWAEWNPEQQASAIEDYNKLLRKGKDGTATLDEMHELSILVGYMQFVWRREGAPTFETPNLEDAPI